MKKKDREENGGIVYIDVSDYALKLKIHGEYHKDKKGCYGKYRKARIIFINQ